MNSDLVRVSKFLSLVLRHKPEAIGLTLDEQGWAVVDALLDRAAEHGRALTRALVEEVVATNDKGRFALSEDGSRIRAVQGHSIAVDLALEPREPPQTLFHGTATRFLDPIRAQGLHSGRRQHVHLSPDEATARKVGARHGAPAVLRIRAGEMWRAGIPFFRAENGVWLTDAVAAGFIDFPSDEGSERPMRLVNSCGVLVFRRAPEQAFLLMRHPNRFDLPKGHRMPGESEVDCALRELQEETGLPPSVIKLDEGFRFTKTYHPRYRRFGGEVVEKTVVIFLGWLVGRQDVVVSEHAAYRWIRWQPPHDLGSGTIDPLLAEVERHFGSREDASL